MHEDKIGLVRTGSQELLVDLREDRLVAGNDPSRDPFVALPRRVGNHELPIALAFHEARDRIVIGPGDFDNLRSLSSNSLKPRWGRASRNEDTSTEIEQARQMGNRMPMISLSSP